MSCEPWQCAEIAATKKANPITKPEVAVAMIKRAARPILVVGSNATERWMEGKQLIEYLIDFAKASKVQVVATAHMVGPEWQGLDGKGHPDLAIFVGLPYYMEALILSGLKHFAPDLRTMTLDNLYHPHASWSYPNGSLEDWANNLTVMTSKFEGGQ
jgi:acetyl-CoA decarbonylase/synthase complex subunit epsilon